MSIMVICGVGGGRQCKDGHGPICNTGRFVDNATWATRPEIQPFFVYPVNDEMRAKMYPTPLAWYAGLAAWK